MFQLNACLAVTLQIYSFNPSATLTAATHYNSPLFLHFFPTSIFCRPQNILELEEEKGWEYQEIMPDVNGGESRRHVEAHQTHCIWLLDDHCLNTGVFRNIDFSNSHRHSHTHISTPAPANKKCSA